MIADAFCGEVIRWCARQSELLPGSAQLGIRSEASHVGRLRHAVAAVQGAFGHDKPYLVADKLLLLISVLLAACSDDSPPLNNHANHASGASSTEVELVNSSCCSAKIQPWLGEKYRFFGSQERRLINAWEQGQPHNLTVTLTVTEIVYSKKQQLIHRIKKSVM